MSDLPVPVKGGDEITVSVDFDAGSDTVDYLVSAICIALKCHMAAEDLLKDGLKYHSLLSAAFIRF